MPIDNELHKAAHKGDIDACKMFIEGSVNEEVPITVNELAVKVSLKLFILLVFSL